MPKIFTADNFVVQGGTSLQFLKADGSVDATNYTHPANHPPSIITQDASNRFVTDTEKATWNAKQSALTNPITGTGTTNYLSKFTGTGVISNSLIFDNGTNVGIGTTNPNSKFELGSGQIAVPFGSAAAPTYSFSGELGTGIFRSSGGFLGFSGNGNAQVYIGNTPNNPIAGITKVIALGGAIDLGNNGTNYIYKSGANNMILQSSGNVGIGYTTGTEITNNRLAVNGSGYFASTVTASNGTLIGGTLTTGQIPKASGTGTLTDSVISESGGNVGIGTVNPKGIVHCGIGNSDAIPFLATGGLSYGWGMFYENTFGNLWISRHEADIYTPAITIVRNNGNVLIGTTTDAGYKLDVNGTGRFSGALTGTSATFSSTVTATSFNSITGLAGNGSATTVSKSDHNHDSVYQTLTQPIPTFYTASFTPSSTNKTALLTYNSSSAGNATIENTGMNIGDRYDFTQWGTGQLTLVAGTSVTLRSPNGTKTRTQYSTISAIKMTATEWLLIGDLTT